PARRAGARRPAGRGRPRRAARRRAARHARPDGRPQPQARPAGARARGGPPTGRPAGRGGPVRIAVTGASGFVGGAVARDAVARGHEVWTYSRRPDGIHGARHRRWDLTDGPLGDAPAVDVVVHAGAVVSDWSDLGVARAVNVAGTRAVRETFGDARFVHVSSGSVYDPFAPSVRAEESEAPV